MSSILSYHGSPELKAAIVDAMKADIAHERLVPGQYWLNGRGCFIGCIIRSNSHADAMSKLGAPLALGHLADACFEGLCKSSIEAGRRFAVDLLEAIPPGADLTSVPDHLMAWIMEYLLRLDSVEKEPPAREAIETVRNLYRRRLDGDEPTDAEWRDARAAARDARAAAWAAAWDASAAAGDASAAAGDASAAAGDAAAAAASAAARDAGDAGDAAWAAYWKSLSAEMIRLCKEQAA